MAHTFYPKKGERYFYIESDGNIEWDFFNDDKVDIDRINFGNAFKTRIKTSKKRDKIRKLLLNL